MASVNWTKFKSAQQVKAVIRHDCKDTREACKEHTNEHLKPELTSQNTGVWDTYAEAKKRYDDRMAELPPPVRKDAVVGVGFSIPAPAGLPEEKEDEWFSRVLDLMGEQYGLENIACYAIHRDEKHEYIDPDTKQVEMSRTHAQGVLVPESGGRLCAKEVTARWRMTAINKAIHQMTEKEFGLQWMDGSQAKSRGNVEQLKARSLQAKNEQLQEENARLREKNADLEAQLSGFLAPVRKVRNMLKTDAEKRAEAAERRAAEAETRQAEAEAAQQEAEEQARKAAQDAAEAEKRRQEAQDAVTALDDKKKALTGDVDGLLRQKASLTDVTTEMSGQITRVAAGREHCTVAERGVIDYLRHNGQYEAIQQQAEQVFNRNMQKAARRKLDDIIADATQRAGQQQPRQQKGHDEIEF